MAAAVGPLAKSLHPLRTRQLGSAGVENQEAVAAEARCTRNEQAILEVGRWDLLKEVQGLFDRRRLFELDAWRLEHGDDGCRHRRPVELVAAAKHPFGFQQRA